MRVLVVSAWEPWRRGDGACLVLHAHLRELASRHDLELLAAGAPGSRTELPGKGTLPPGVRGGWYGSALPAPADAALRRVRRGREPAHVAYVARRPLLADLRRAVTERRPDVVHLFGWGTAALQPHLDGLPAVHDAVDPWAANLRNRATGAGHALLDRGEASRVAEHERRWYPSLSTVVVRTEQDADELRREVPGVRARVVPNGVDPGPEPAAGAEGPLLAFLGAYDARSNVEAATALVTEVLPLVRAARPDVGALLIGRDPPPELLRLAGPHVELTGTVPDVRPDLERAAVLVAPLRSGRGVKNKVLEAMAAGRPVVATAQALHGIGASEGVREAETPAEQAEAVLLWLASGAAAAGKANRERVLREHTWARSAALLEDLWEQAACASTS